MSAPSTEVHFDPQPTLLREYVIAGLISACEIAAADDINSYGQAIADQWARVPSSNRTALVFAVLLVDHVYRKEWMPRNTAAADWGYDQRVLHLVNRVIPTMAQR